MAGLRQIVATAAGAYIVYLTVRILVSRMAHAMRARKFGCKPASYKGLTGIRTILDLLDAKKNFVVPQTIEKNFESVKGETFSWAFVDNRILCTSDPLNVQAMLAKQFEDFEIGQMRRSNFWPMLGGGIFTADGKFWYVFCFSVAMFHY